MLPKKPDYSGYSHVSMVILPEVSVAWNPAVDGMLYFMNRLGHSRRITMEQWAELLAFGGICGCNNCFACRIYMTTQMIINATPVPKGAPK